MGESGCWRPTCPRRRPAGTARLRRHRHDLAGVLRCAGCAAPARRSFRRGWRPWPGDGDRQRAAGGAVLSRAKTRSAGDSASCQRDSGASAQPATSGARSSASSRRSSTGLRRMATRTPSSTSRTARRRRRPCRSWCAARYRPNRMMDAVRHEVQAHRSRSTGLVDADALAGPRADAMVVAHLGRDVRCLRRDRASCSRPSGFMRSSRIQSRSGRRRLACEWRLVRRVSPSAGWC